MFLITPQEVVDYAFGPTDSVSPDSIRDIRIETAQLRYILPVVGPRLYTQLLGGTHPELTENYLKPALAQYIRAALVEELATQVTDHGTGRSTLQESERTVCGTKNDDTTHTGTGKTTAESQREITKETTGSRTGKTTTQTTAEETSSQAVARENTEDRITDTTLTALTNGMDLTTTGDITTPPGSQSQKDIQSEKRDTGKTTLKSTGTDNSSTDTTREQSEKRTSDTTDATTESGTTVDSGNTISNKTTTSTESRKTQDTDQEESRRNNFLPASLDERRRLVRQAMQDARMLMLAAVRHIESRRGDFPDYAPALRRPVLGGLVL